MVEPDQGIRLNSGLTSLYGIKADDTHTSLFLQVLQLTLPVAAHGTVHLPQRREEHSDQGFTFTYTKSKIQPPAVYGDMFIHLVNMGTITHPKQNSLMLF